MAKITDLTGYTVTVPSGWTANAGYGRFDVVGTAYDTSELNPSPYFIDGFNIGYTWGGDGDSFWVVSDSDVICDNNVLYFNIYFNDSFEITFTGGNDVTSPDLIQWFYDNNATFTKPEEPETPEQPTTPTKKFTRLYIGEIVKTIGNKVFRKLQITAPIKFTIGGTEYQAEPSMTFGEWLESGYNTSDYYTKTITSGGVEYNPIIIAEDGDVFTVVETKGAIIEVGTPITAGAEYKTVILTQDSALPVWNGTDLTGTTWEINSQELAPMSQPLSFFISGDISFSSYTAYNGKLVDDSNNPSIKIGYKTTTINANYISFLIKSGSATKYESFDCSWWKNIVYIYITGGTDAKNTSLISWLKQYGTLTSHTMA